MDNCSQSLERRRNSLCKWASHNIIEHLIVVKTHQPSSHLLWLCPLPTKLANRQRSCFKRSHEQRILCKRTRVITEWQNSFIFYIIITNEEQLSPQSFQGCHSMFKYLLWTRNSIYFPLCAMRHMTAKRSETSLLPKWIPFAPFVLLL